MVCTSRGPRRSFRMLVKDCSHPLWICRATQWILLAASLAWPVKIHSSSRSSIIQTDRHCLERDVPLYWSMYDDNQGWVSIRRCVSTTRSRQVGSTVWGRYWIWWAEACGRMSCMHHILGIRWYDFVTNAEVIEPTHQESLTTQIQRRRLALFDDFQT